LSKTKLSLMQSARESNMSASLINQLAGAKTIEELTALAGQIASKPVAQTTSTVNVNGHTLLIDSKTGTTIKDLGTSTTSSGNTYSFTPTVKTQLLGAGNTMATISQLESDIATHGAQYVLDNGQMDSATQQAIETEFGITKTAPVGTKPWYQFW
jgi:hypothetical protein